MHMKDVCLFRSELMKNQEESFGPTKGNRGTFRTHLARTRGILGKIHLGKSRPLSEGFLKGDVMTQGTQNAQNIDPLVTFFVPCVITKWVTDHARPNQMSSSEDFDNFWR